MQGEIKKAQEFASAQLSYRARQFRVAARATLRGARRYSVFVRVMKGALPLTALGLGILVLVYVLQPPPARLQMSFQQISNLANDLSMDRPRLSGTDNDGQPFVISASRATPVSGSIDRIRLMDIVADFSVRDGTSIHVTAGSGVVDTTTRVLQMADGIHMAAQNGYQASTQSAVADLRAGTIHGENGIAANGALGRITAQRFAMNRSTKQMHFSGNVRMILNPDSPIMRQQGKPR
jgi:lipopolysaccharide export system protein LptC